jgi:uncharacterized Zn-finger protein
LTKEGKHPLSVPERADNAEESIKCPFCGTMFGLGYGNEEVVACPVCDQQIVTEDMDTIYASNEDF